MKKIVLAIALAIASLNAAQAQNAPVDKQLRFLVGGGLTFGGDKLITVKYENDVDMSVRAGGMIALTGGVEYRVSNAFSLQATLGYHVDNTSASNADARFDRFPMELLAYYHLSPQWRVGGGARYVSNPKFKTSGVADIGDYTFDNTIGGLVEVEYLMNEHVGFKLRYVQEKYESKQIRGKIDGNHVGMLANFYF
jgi:opacity protein-like surface antigen